MARKMDQWVKIENPERDPFVYIYLIYDTSEPWGKDNLFNTWY